MATMDLTHAKILIVDDEEANIDLLETLLREEGYSHLTSTRESRDVFTICSESDPDLVLLDLHMPQQDGFAVMEQLKGCIPEGTYLPILVLTADINPEVKQRALSEGARDFLAKPLDAAEALVRIKNLLETRFLHIQQQTARNRAEFLAEALRVLGSSFDYQTTLSTLARLTVPRLADYCFVDIIEADGRLVRVGIAHRDPDKEPLLRDVTHFQPGELPREHPEMRALLEGRGVLVAEVMPGMAEAVLANEDHLRMVRMLEPRSLMAVPLTVSEKVLGAMVLVSSESDRRFDSDDLSLAEALGRRAALAVENARLFNEAQQATRARDEMLAVVAHDLRNPLNTIFMSAGHLLDGLTSTQDLRSGRKSIEIIRRAAERMNALIQDLLDVQRLESGRLTVEPCRQNAAVFVREAVDMLRPLAAANYLSLETDVPRDLPDVLADSARIQQVLSNLVGNAIKFTPAGGKVTVRALAQADNVRIAVSDTGVGIPAEQLPHIFGHFWQANHNDRRGIGLGLAIAKGIVEAHRGRIWVESRPGEGSTFYFTLPVGGDGDSLPPGHD
ncbi:MAG TPA: ATP-binding protein [Longimicrobiaceae bacterium]|nr:ATP-binding protein [Longimicrobiaceae bacterium]